MFFFTSMFLLLEGKPHVVCGYMSVCSHIREFSIEFYGIFGTTWNQQALIGCFPFSILATLHLFFTGNMSRQQGHRMTEIPW